MNEIAVKDDRKKFTALINEYESVKNAVHFMTKGRECVWVKFDAYRDSYIDKNMFIARLAPSGRHRKSVYFLYRGKTILSRDLTDINRIKTEEALQYALNAGGETITHKQAVRDGIFEDAELKITLYTYGEEEANSLFLGDILQFKSKSGSPYMDVMFLEVDLKLQQVTDEPVQTNAVEKAGRGAEKFSYGEYIDIADLKAYNTLRRILLTKHMYKDDLNIEYSISSGSETAYYILDEWYSNHVWARDPAVFYVFRITAHKTEEAFPREYLKRKHPIRSTESIWGRNGAREDYYIESIDAEFKTNNGIKLFVSRKRKEKNPKEGSLSFNTLFDFKEWLECRDSEIYDA